MTAIQPQAPIVRLARGLGVAAAAGLALAGCGKNGGVAAEAGYRIYATNEISGDLSVIDSRSGKVEAVIKLGKRPRGVVVSPDGRFVFVALTGSPIAGPGVDESTLPPPDKAADGVGVVNAASLNLVKVLKGVSDPEQLGVARDGRTLFLASQDIGKLLVLDADSGAVRMTGDAGAEPEGVALSPDGKQIYVSSEEGAAVTAFDAATLKPLARIPVGKRPRGIAFSPDGARAYVTGENDASLTAIDTASHTVLQTVSVSGAGAKPMGVVVAPDGKSLFVSTGRGGALVRFDTASLKPTGSVAVGARPWGVAISPDGKRVYTANGQSNDISVIDAQAMVVVSRIKAADRPWGVAVGPRPGS